MAYCNPCDRSFSSYRAYEQHIDNSSFHRNSNQQSNYYESSSEYESSSSEEEESGWECDVCDRTFISEDSLHQHCSAASGHPYCISCKRIFSNENNLKQVCDHSNCALKYILTLASASTLQNPYGWLNQMSLLRKCFYHSLWRNNPSRIRNLYS